MEGSFSSSNQNQSKTLDELVRKKLYEAMATYTHYLYKKGDVLKVVAGHIPQALPSLLELIEKLENFGECKSFLTNDQEALQKCIDEYNFKDSLLIGIWDYTWRHLQHLPKKIKEFTKGLEDLAKGGEQVIKDLYNRYLQYKTTSIPQEDIDPIASLILRYLENPKGYGKQLSKYLGKRQYLSLIKQAFLALPQFIKYLGKRSRVEARKEIKVDEELWDAIEANALYASYMIYALYIVRIVSEHAPEVLPSLATLIENLREWSRCNSLLTNNQEALKECTDKYYFMTYFMASIPGWGLPKLMHTPEEIERFKKGLKALAEGGKEIIDGLYRHYKEVERTTLEKILKDESYQTVPPYKLEEARERAGKSIRDLLVNYFRNPEEYRYQLMKYVEKPLGR